MTRNNKQKFDVQCSDGNVYTCFRPDVASKAQAAVQQQGVTIMVSFKDQYKNFEDVLPAGAVPQGFSQPAQGFVPQPAPQAQNFGAPQQQFTPAPGFVDAKEARIIRGNGVNAASAALAPLIGTGAFLNDDGDLDTEAVAGEITALAGKLARYIDKGPVTDTGATVPQGAPELPPGVTPEQVAAWAEQQATPDGATVQVGAPVPEAAPAAPATAY